MLLAPVFRSTLPEDERLSVEQLVDRSAPAGRRRAHVGGVDDIVDTIVSEQRDGDLVVMMSNGGFDGIHRKLVSRLEARAPPLTDCISVGSDGPRISSSWRGDAGWSSSSRGSTRPSTSVCWRLRDAIEQSPPAGVLDVVPAYATSPFTPIPSSFTRKG